jgi:hypothetical protein
VNLTTLEIGEDEARERLAEYTQAIGRERNAEDEAIAAAYRAAARGLPIISLPAAVTAGGFFDNGLPRIAICRADAASCRVDWEDHNRLVFRDNQAQRWRHVRSLVGLHTVSVRTERPTGVRVYAGTTVVPPVPPRHRPRRGRIGLFHILWEVEQWDPTPPRDPALLRHIRGDLWAVLATWDLTDIERHVLAQRVRT